MQRQAVQFCKWISKAKIFHPLVLSVIAFASVWDFAMADGLPKAEDGYLYYCAGVRSDKLNGNPNAIAVFKLRKDEVRDEERAMVLCKADFVDERFIVKRFLETDDDLITGFINFKLPVEIEGKYFEFEVGSGGIDSYLTERSRSQFSRYREKCSFEENPQNGLMVIKKSADQLAAC